ncbi:hypothetical protein [Acidovorax sp. Leaf160]|uniref:hypothetical protein n=1 Tax=Acidovorax sp. Leaf160 TaxID=1736280 RepID=UPI0006F72462|nr:hypothetical protein [Acidovorax sp. Leaf160]KQR44960.1 hypothetical protein ASF94_09870 [Acidovorax sp. Leaf160]
MAVGWMTALKLVPWSEVIEATPQILQAARRLMGSAQRAPAGPSPAAGATAALGVSTADQLAVMREALLQLQDEQRASATLIESLAEQNAVLVRAVDALRVRQQRLLWGVGALGAATLVLLAWAINQ